ncbi:MAG: GNAT family N-acetyltransferase [Patescibacteria group bacterium]
MIKFTVRKLSEKDLTKGFFETLENLIPVGNLSLSRAKDIFREISQNPVYNIYVAESETGEIIGATTLLIEQKFLGKGSRMAHIEDVSTRKGFERQGVGKTLVKTAIEEAKRRGCFRIDLTCADENVSFYERRGFVEEEHTMKIWVVPLEELVRRAKEKER